MVKKNLKKHFQKYWLVWLLILIILLRLPSLFEPFTYADEGIYLTLGQALRQGLVWYRDIHDNKPPMLYLLAALAGDFPTYRLLLFFWGLATIFVFFKLSQLLFPKNKSAIIVSTATFTLLTSTHTFEGNIGNAENFMLLPTIIAFFFILKTVDKTVINHKFVKSLSIWFLVGVLFSLATLLKVPAAFDFVAALVFILLMAEKKNYKLLITNYFLLLLGFILPILLTIIYYASKGALNQYLTAAFFQNLPYLSSWVQDKPQVSGLPLPLLSRGFLVLALVLVLFIFRKRGSLVAKLVLVWFAFSWFAALLSSRPYPHYLIQILPSLSLSFGLFFSQPGKYLKEKLIPTSLLVILVVTWITFRFWYYVNLPYLINFYQYALRIKSHQEYFSNFDPRTETIYQTAEYLKVHTLPEEKIFIWGTDPSIYALSRRLPAGRYAVAYHIVDFNGYQETIEALTKNPPRYLVVIETEKHPFPELFNFIELNYLLEEKINSAKIFHRYSIID